MSKSERIDVVLKREVRYSASKRNGVLTNALTLKNYDTWIKYFCDWCRQKYGIKRMHQIAQLGHSPQSLIQEYEAYLYDHGKKPDTIHTYLAPICKGFGIGMSEIQKPTRAHPDRLKGVTSTGKTVICRSPRDVELARLADIVTVRKTAFSKLTTANLIQDENGDFTIQREDKLGKVSCQLLLPHEVDFVQRMLSTDEEGHPLQDGKHPFTLRDLAHINFSDCRYRRAQEMQRYFEVRYNSWRDMPTGNAAQRQERNERRRQAEAEKRMWIEKLVAKFSAAHAHSPQAIRKFRERLEKPSRYVMRSNNREIASRIGRPESYDRVALKICSIYCLSHWEDDSTIRNYLNKKLAPRESMTELSGLI